MRVPGRKALSFCHARLPKAGLGNKLFVWGRAFLFARMNQLPLVVTGWTRLQKAPLWHGGDLRLYLNYFRRVRQVGVLRRWMTAWSGAVVREPLLTVLEPPRRPTVFEFHDVPHWRDHFSDLKPYREEVRAGLIELLTPARRRELAAAPRPSVCVQVRLGDFRPLGPGEDFARVGGVRTPLEYFRHLVRGLRELHGTELPVTVVSDGRPRQLRELLAMPGVTMGPPNSAIVDVLMMASSKVLVPAAGSTFGYWGGFLGECCLIIHPDHIHQPIRPASVNARFYEGPAVGPAAAWPELLRRNIAAIAAPAPIRSSPSPCSA